MAISKAYRRLEALYEASRLVVSELDLKKRLESILDGAIKVTGADRGFIVLLNEDDGSLSTEVAREMGADAATGSPSMGIASRSALQGELVIAEDALQDERFSSRQSVILGQIRSAMSVPLKVEERILGSIYVDSRDPRHKFTPEDLELFEAVASQSAIAIENVRLTEKMIEEERRRNNLERFLSPRVVDEVISKEGTIELGGTKREIAALFSDIRGFTGLAEKMAPVDVVSMLNEYFTEMAEVIFQHDGTLDKYVGDEIMAVFGAPVQAHDHAVRAVKVALEMQKSLRLMRERWTGSGQPAFEIGIGVATGTAIAGYIGSPRRMEFTAIGDIVNVARRLCSQAEPGQVLACGETFERLGEIVSGRALGPILLKGKEIPVSVHEVLGVR
jgi:adenylate cyclase